MHEDLKVKEVASLLRVSNAAVLTWIKNGKLTAYSVSMSDASRPLYRITRSAVDDFRMSRQVASVGKTSIKRTRKRMVPPGTEQFF